MSTDVATEAQLSKAEKLFTLLGMMLGLLLAALDQTIVATAGPAIQADLNIEPSMYPWLTTSYMVMSTVMVPIYGKLSDLFGRKPVLIVSILIFLAGSLLCGAAQSTLQLILFRAVQGVGSAGLFTSAFAIVADIFTPAERGKYQGLLGAVFALSSVVGPFIGGFITDFFGWHWVFLVNLPVGGIALALIFARMPTLRSHSGTSPRIDYAGALALMVAVVPLLLALSLGRRDVPPGETGFEWGSWQILTLFAAAALGTVTFVVIERRAPEPLLDLSLFRNRTFALSNVASFVLGGTFFVSVVFLPLFMVNVVGLSATNSGLTLTPLTFGLVAGNVLSGQLVARLGRYKALMLGSLALNVVGFAVMAFTLTTASTQADVTLRMVLLGIGLGPAVPMFTLIIQNAVEARQVGVATSSVTFFRSLGGTVGLAVFGTIFGAVLSSHLAERMPEAASGLPAQLRQQFAAGPLQTNVATEDDGARAGQAFPVEKLKAQVRSSFQRQREQLASSQVPPALREHARRALGVSEAQAVAAVDRVHETIRASFTDAIRAVYQVTIALAVLALLLTFFLPDLPLRRGPPTGAASAAAASGH